MAISRSDFGLGTRPVCRHPRESRTAAGVSDENRVAAASRVRWLMECESGERSPCRSGSDFSGSATVGTICRVGKMRFKQLIMNALHG
jgi:hypothetical protein